MSPLLRILHLEDNPTDAELVRGMLEAAGVDCAIRRVETREAFQSALEREQFDLVISDFTLPSFDGLSALTICRHKKPELPFIFVSGTIGEDAAVESLKRGATDYVIKDRLSRLATSVERAVQEAQSQAERLRADEKIREQAALLDKARDAICVMDMEFTILYWNRGAERLYGWSVEEAVGQSAHDLLFGGNVSLLLEAVKQLVRQNEWQGELHKNSKDGRENVVESRWTLLRDALWRPKSILLIDSDITEKKQIEAQLFRTQRVQSIGAVAGGIAHDLNNMLAPILMVTELLRDELTSEQSRKMLDTAKASAQRGAEMVKQILAFARGAGGEPKTIQLKHLVNEMVRLIGDTFPRSIQVESRVDIAGRKKRADYLFRTDGIDRFVCEAKKPKEELSNGDAYQAQRYSFNLKLLIAALTNFESLKLFVVGGKPDQAAPWDACKEWHYLEFVDKAQELWDLFARENVAAGSLDRLLIPATVTRAPRACPCKVRQY